MRFYPLLLLLLVLSARGESLVAENGWARATPPGGKAAAVYARLENRGSEAVVIAEIGSPIAAMAHLHETVTDNGMMRMRPRDDFTLAAGETAELAPGGLHIMLMGLSKPLNEGDRIVVEITTTTGESISLPVDVGSISQMTPP